MNCACTKRAAGADRQLQLMVMEFNFRRGRIRDSLNVGTEGPIGPLGRDHEKVVIGPASLVVAKIGAPVTLAPHFESSVAGTKNMTWDTNGPPPRASNR
jgi:hypothetical protein